MECRARAETLFRSPAVEREVPPPLQSTGRYAAENPFGMWGREDSGRIGVEANFTRQQRLEDHPYRSQSEGYVRDATRSRLRV